MDNMFLDYTIATSLLMVLTGAVCYYIGERGMAGVKIDLDNTKNELAKVQALVAKKTDTKTTTGVTPL